MLTFYDFALLFTTHIHDYGLIKKQKEKNKPKKQNMIYKV